MAEPPNPTSVTMKWGVYSHQDDDSYLIETYDTEDQAWEFMRLRADSAIAKHPEWSATDASDRTNGMLEIKDDRGAPQSRYECCKVTDHSRGQFARVSFSGEGSSSEHNAGSTSSDREDESSSSTVAASEHAAAVPPDSIDTVQNAETIPNKTTSKDAQMADENTTNYQEDENTEDVQNAQVADTPINESVYYGVYMSRNLQEPNANTPSFLGWHKSLGEAKNAISLIAGGQVRDKNRQSKEAYVRPGNNSLEILSVQDKRPLIRYNILEGRLEKGRFVKQDDWLSGVRQGERVAYPQTPGIVAPAGADDDVVEEDQPSEHQEEATSDEVQAPPAAPAVKRNARPQTGKNKHVTVNDNDRRTSRKRKRAGEEQDEAESKAPEEDQAQAPAQAQAASEVADEEIYCVCRKPSDNNTPMVGCDGEEDCPYGGWFHFACVGLKAKPKTKKWFCEQCAPRKQASKKQAQKKQAPKKKASKRQKSRR